jgi:hypothetical protein
VKIIVDGQPWGDAESASRPSLDVYRELVRREFGRGRTVVSVFFDGLEASPQEQERMLAGEKLDVESMEFRTMSTEDLVRGTLDELTRHFTPLREALEATARWLAEGERRRALDAFRPSLDLWLGLCETVQRVCVLMLVDVGTPIGATSVLQAHEKIAASLAEVQACFEAQDWTRLASVISDGMLASVDEWEAIVKSLRERVSPA